MGLITLVYLSEEGFCVKNLVLCIITQTLGKEAFIPAGITVPSKPNLSIFNFQFQFLVFRTIPPWYYLGRRDIVVVTTS